MLGIIGDQKEYDSGVISDAVNTASRMEGFTQIFGCSIIVSGNTLAELKHSPAFEKAAIQYRLRGIHGLPVWAVDCQTEDCQTEGLWTVDCELSDSKPFVFTEKFFTP